MESLWEVRRRYLCTSPLVVALDCPDAHSVSHVTGCLDLDLVQGRVGIPKDRVSGFQSFEAPDPALWTSYGYAVINVDARGIFKSEGDIRLAETNPYTYLPFLTRTQMARFCGRERRPRYYRIRRHIPVVKWACCIDR